MLETTSIGPSGSKERVRAYARKHWLGEGLPPEKKEMADEIRRQYYATAKEYFQAALRLYESLTAQTKGESAPASPFARVNRNVQLFLAFSILWEGFDHIYTAASYTEFCRNGPERGPAEPLRVRVDRVLRAPILPEADVAKISILRNGETPSRAVSRFCDRSSRELSELYDGSFTETITDMDAFLQGMVVAGKEKLKEGDPDHWAVRPLGDDGKPIDPEGPFTVEKYRSVIKWLCLQIRLNLNFVGKSDGSIDDAILIMRAFGLLEPIVELLLRQNRCELIFAL